MKLSDNVKFIKGVGETRAELFGKLGIITVRDLLEFYPRAYEDRTKTVSIAQAVPGENAAIIATVMNTVKKSEIRNGLTVFKCDVRDDENIMTVTIFNNRFAAAKLKEGEEYLFYGKVNNSAYRREMVNPQIDNAASGKRIRPIYPQTAKLYSSFIETCVRRALELLDDGFDELIDRETTQRLGLIDKNEAVCRIHFPENENDITTARQRLCFDELLTLQTGMMLLRSRKRSNDADAVITDYSDDFFSLLPFSPTEAQKRSVKEAVEDMRRSVPMSRLLQGDVGSGKTAVAAALCYNTVKNGFQCAIMAPTEILAKQHYDTIKKLFSDVDMDIELLTGSTSAKEKRRIKEELSSGVCSICIGTHALIQGDVSFKALNLVVTDEQHRFGVAQRSALNEKGKSPHTLVMSATPIPRTLALMIYGDLDVSVLDELPKGRKKIKTYAIDSSLKERAYGYVKKHLDIGKQAYIVCPLVEENEASPLASAEEEAERLSEGVFRGYNVGLLHGRMKQQEKDAVMSAFASGSISLLVSTTVVEVGVDVPNAVIMLVEDADRFGLSQLHQLRGRVGRGEFRSKCILVSDSKSKTAQQRMKIMCETTDGFRIADEDLRLRGPGDFFGKRQHGLPELKIADLTTDMGLLRTAQGEAKRILDSDSNLWSEKNLPLKKAVIKLFEEVGPGGMN